MHMTHNPGMDTNQKNDAKSGALPGPWGLAVRIMIHPAGTLRRLSGLSEAGALPSWPRVFLRLGVPLIVVSVLVSQWLYTVIPTGLPPEAMPDPWGFGVYSALTMSIGVLGLAAGAHYMSELFQGHSVPERAMLASIVGLIPAWWGNVIAAFPWPWGNVTGLALILSSLVLLYWSLRMIAGLRRGNRIGVFVAAVFCGLFVTLIFGWALMDLIPGAVPEHRMGTTWLI